VTEVASFAARVAEVRAEADQVRSLRLVRADGGDLPPWTPGAHIDVAIPDGSQRQYSLCGDPDDDSWQIAVLREQNSRGGSRFLHEDVVVGTELTVRGPRNHFPLESADSYLFIGGGIGITPLRTMISEVRRRGLPWRLVYGARSRSAMAFRDELDALGSAVTIWPQDEHGLLPIVEEIAAAGPGAAIYCCGPEPMLSAMEQACRDAGRPDPFLERFAPAPDSLADADPEAFEIELARSGEVFPIGEHDTIMDVLEANGYPVDSSCREGICGTCETAVLAGTPIHHDSVLTQADYDRGDCMMVCVSRAPGGSRLLLDR
jgi:ferredoxin-NADP reductase